MITPIEVRQQTFNKAIRGYNIDDVKSFLLSLSREWENLVEENKKNKSELEKVRESLKNYKEMETIMHKTLLQAEQSSKVAVENARKDAEITLQQAQHKAFELVQHAYEEKTKIEQDIIELINKREDILTGLKAYLNGQVERIKSFEATMAAKPVFERYVYPKNEEISTITKQTQISNVEAYTFYEPQTIVQEAIVINETNTIIDNTTTNEQIVSNTENINLKNTNREENILDNYLKQQSFFDSAIKSGESSGLINDIVNEL